MQPRAVRFTVAEGVELAGDAYGDPSATPIVLLHGGGQTRHAWGSTAAHLAEAGYYAVAIDQRGHGESSWAPDGVYELESFTDDLRAVASQLGAPPILVGASLGGLVGLIAEGERLGTLRALVLVDVAPRLRREGVDRVLAFMLDRADTGFATLEEAADAVARYMPHRPRPKDLSGLEKNLRSGEDGRYRWHWDPRFLKGDRRTDVPRMAERLFAASRALTLPTLLVRGQLSDVLSEEAAAEFLELAPHAELVDVRDAAHMIAGDSNDVFTGAVVAFLQKMPAR